MREMPARSRVAVGGLKPHEPVQGFRDKRIARRICGPTELDPSGLLCCTQGRRMSFGSIILLRPRARPDLTKSGLGLLIFFKEGANEDGNRPDQARLRRVTASMQCAIAMRTSL